MSGGSMNYLYSRIESDATFLADTAEQVILMKTTKDTGFVVSHWQCSDKPGYKPCGLNHAGQVRLWGDAGCWSGPYGNWVGLTDLLRYARNTVREHA